MRAAVSILTIWDFCKQDLRTEPISVLTAMGSLAQTALLLQTQPVTHGNSADFAF